MGIVRKPVETVADADHKTVILEGEAKEKLPLDRVYINLVEGTARDGRRGDRLGDLTGGEEEIPRTAWHS